MMPTTGDYIKLHFIVFLWGFTAILGKLITLPAVEMVFYRTAIAAAGMAMVIFFRSGSLSIKFSDALKLFAIGLLVALHWISFFGSARLANVSVSLVGFATASLWTSLLEPLAQRKKVKGFEVGLGLCVIAGIFMIFSFSDQYRVGFLVGILSGFLAAVFSVINAGLVHRIPSRVITFYEMTGAFIGIGLFLPLYARQWAPGGELHLVPVAADIFYLIVLSLVCTVYAFTAMVELMKKIAVFFIQLTINLEPVYGIILALIFFGESEQMSFNFYLGALIILSAIALYPYLKRRHDRSLAQKERVPLQ